MRSNVQYIESSTWESRDGTRERREELCVQIADGGSEEAERRAPELDEVVLARGHLASVEARQARSQLLHLRGRNVEEAVCIVQMLYTCTVLNARRALY